MKIKLYHLKSHKALSEIEGKDLDVHINSPGGDVFESIAICNLLKQYDGNVDIYIDAMAGSGASVIATAEKIYTCTATLCR